MDRKRRKPRSAPAAEPQRRLELDAIVRAALDLLGEVGLDDLSMRRLADELGVQNPALYWHVRDKQELLDRMAQALLADGFAASERKQPARAWRPRLERFAHGLRDAMKSRRDGARLVAAADLTRGLALVSRMERLAQGLIDDGFGAQHALGGILTVVHYTLGATFEEQSDPRKSDPVLAPSAAFPVLSALADEADGTRISRLDARFTLGIGLILDGLGARRQRRSRSGSARRTKRSRGSAP